MSSETHSGGGQDSSRSKPPTMRTIAAAAGVSRATVSLALRDHPSIALATRERVRRLAAELGYVPDPEVAKLMHHLQRRQKPRFRAAVAAITTLAAGAESDYATAVRNGAERTAREFGYSFDVFRIASDDAPVDFRLRRVLWNRGVEGLLLLPMHEAVNLEAMLEWDRFSVVAATCAVTEPQFHRVAPDQYSNAFTICRHLTQLGCRRIGLVLDRRVDLIVGHRFSAAIAWQNVLGGTDDVTPYVYDEKVDGRLRDWFRQQCPDAIVAATDNDARAIATQLNIPLRGGAVLFAVEDWTEQSGLAGVDQRCDEVGAAAIKALHMLLQRSERGVPSLPSLTTVPGRWMGPRTPVEKRDEPPAASKTSAGQ